MNKESQITKRIDSIVPNDEPLVRRIFSHATSSREGAFTRDVRTRDKAKCVFTGKTNSRAQFGKWAGWQAAHIFPREKESLWVENNFGRWITNTNTGDHSASINSIQNGFLVLSHIHQMFDDYAIAVNPDVRNHTLYMITALS